MVAAVGVWGRYNVGQGGLHQGLSAAQRPHRGERAAGTAAGVAGQGWLGAPLQVRISPVHIFQAQASAPEAAPEICRPPEVSCCYCYVM